ncbi:hypothetical protein [Bacillus mycoides]|uniref:hypothetical protein n=1 Tax=Bacillus mycoides TaxID=1405 RepID=UPI002E1A67CA|nr:hypothetical protein [Bacillus mycoides]
MIISKPLRVKNDEGAFMLEINLELLGKSVCLEEGVLEDVILLYDELLKILTDLEIEDKAS